MRTAKEEIERIKAAFPGKNVAVTATVHDCPDSKFSHFNAHAGDECTSSMHSLEHAVEQLLALAIKGEPQDATAVIDQMEGAAQ